MIKFQTNKFLPNIIGDGNVLPKSLEQFGLRERYIVPIICTFSLLSVQLVTSIDFILNIRVDILRACTSLITATVFLMSIQIYWHFMINRKQFYSLVDAVEDIVGESVCDRCTVDYCRINLLTRSIDCRNEANRSPGNLHRNRRENQICFEFFFVYYCRTRCHVFHSFSICGLSLVLGCLYCGFVVLFLSNVVTEYRLFLGFPMHFSKIEISRMPFEVTTARCAFLASMQFSALFHGAAIFYLVTSLLIEVTMYSASILADITTTFSQLDRLSKTENPERLMLEHCKGAVDLHEWINRYLLSRFG